MTDTPLLHVDKVSVVYDGFRALDDFSLSLAPKTMRVVIGPNGAGKSTLCDTIIGRVRPTTGEVFFRGRPITKTSEQEIARQGICRKFQAPGILPALTVEENLALAARKDRRWWTMLSQSISAPDQQAVDEAVEMIGFEEKRDAIAGALAHGDKQWLEIAMVIATGAELLLLDEPTAGMGPAETSRTADLIRRLAADKTILVIDHDMSFVEQLAAPVTVMHQGRLLKEGSLEEVRSDPEVAAVYLGRSAA